MAFASFGQQKSLPCLYNNKTEGLALIPLFPEQQEIILWQKKSELSETILRSEVQPCSPSIEYYPLDRQIVLKTEMIDEDGNDYGKPMEESSTA